MDWFNFILQHPDREWDFDEMISNPRITWEIIQQNLYYPDTEEYRQKFPEFAGQPIPWRLELFGSNYNLTMELILEHPEITFSYYYDTSITFTQMYQAKYPDTPEWGDRRNQPIPFFDDDAADVCSKKNLTMEEVLAHPDFFTPDIMHHLLDNENILNYPLRLNGRLVCWDPHLELTEDNMKAVLIARKGSAPQIIDNMSFLMQTLPHEKLASYLVDNKRIPWWVIVKNPEITAIIINNEDMLQHVAMYKITPAELQKSRYYSEDMEEIMWPLERILLYNPFFKWHNIIDATWEDGDKIDWGDYSNYSWNPNITWDIVDENPDIEWDYSYYLSINPQNSVPIYLSAEGNVMFRPA